jgi:hypothetical protein
MCPLISVVVPGIKPIARLVFRDFWDQSQLVPPIKVKML